VQRKIPRSTSRPAQKETKLNNVVHLYPSCGSTPYLPSLSPTVPLLRQTYISDFLLLSYLIPELKHAFRTESFVIELNFKYFLRRTKATSKNSSKIHKLSKLPKTLERAILHNLAPN